MSIKVITDSTANIPQELIDELDITVIPIYVHFGDKTFRDGVDISSSEFYSLQQTSPVYPSTSQPNPEDFIAVYDELSESHDGIVSVHISTKTSGTCNSAFGARDAKEYGCPVEVVDSRFTSSGLGLVAVAAARAAKTGAGIKEVVQEAEKAIRQVRIFGMFEHMTYLARSGRISKTIASASTFLNVMPLLTFTDGELARAGFVRKVEKGMEKIYTYVKNNLPVQELSIAHSAVEDRAIRLRELLSEFMDIEAIPITEIGASLGVHGGPGVLLVGLRTSS
ncbi:MAG: DegV family protein [Dehalococcoidales bacterium]|nr:DegV family protein [Dehalococcoidales bacterium]